MDVFMKELCSTSTTQKFFPQGGKSAGEVMCESYVPPPGPSTFAASVVACTRLDGIGHAVNMYHRRGSTTGQPIFLDHQHSNFGMPADHDVIKADAITVFTPGAYLSSLEQREANERRLDLFIEGKMSYHEWVSGERTQDGPIPSFEAFKHHVKLLGSERYRNN